MVLTPIPCEELQGAHDAVDTKDNVDTSDKVDCNSKEVVVENPPNDGKA